MGTSFSLYRESNRTFYTPTSDSLPDNDDLFYDYVEATFGIKPTNLHVGYTTGQNSSESSSSHIYRVPRTVTNSQFLAAFPGQSNNMGLIDMDISLLSISLICIVFIVIVYLMSNSLFYSCIIAGLFLLALLYLSGITNVLPFPETSVSPPQLQNKQLTDKQLSDKEHVYEGEFKPDLTGDNIPYQMAKWALAKLGTDDADTIFPPINDNFVTNEVNGMTAQVVYKDGPLQMEKITLKSGTLVPKHTHDLTHVAAFRISGTIQFAGNNNIMKPWIGNTVMHIAPGTTHSVLALSDSVFYTVHMSGNSLLLADFKPS